MPEPRLRIDHELPPSADLVIVGGGIIGVATAFWAARAGFKPVVLEARPALATLTTPASVGGFREQFDNPEELALVQRTIALYSNFSEITGLSGWDLGLQRQGYVWCTSTEVGMQRQRELVELQQSWGLRDVELLSGDEARYRFPYLGDAVRQARYHRHDGWVEPRALTMGLASASGAHFVVETRVTGFRQAGGRLAAIETSRGVIETERAVIAAGPFSGEVARLAGVELPIRTVRRQKVVMPRVPEVPNHAPMTIDEDTGAHWRPHLDGANLLYTVHADPASPPAWDVQPIADFALGLLNPANAHSVARIVPFWREVWARNTAYWLLHAGQYTYTPDHRPLLGESAVPGLFINTGYSGHGLMAGSGGGSQILVETLTGALRPDANVFRPDRDFVHRHLDVL